MPLFKQSKNQKNEAKITLFNQLEQAYETNSAG